MRTIYIFLFLLLGTIVSCGQGIPIRDELHYGKGQMTCDYCLTITVYTDGYNSKYQKNSYLVTAIGDTLDTIDKSSLSFNICPENYGDLFLYVNDTCRGRLNVSPINFVLHASKDSAIVVKTPCDNSVPMSELDITKVLNNDYLSFGLNKETSVLESHEIACMDSIDVEIVEPEYRERVKFVDGKLLFQPFIEDGREIEVFHYSLKMAGAKPSSPMPVTIRYSEDNNLRLKANLSANTAFVDVFFGVEPYQYLWNDSVITLDNTFSNLLDGKNKVQVTDAYGCVDSVSFKYMSEFKFLYPELLTPNGDGTNDKWYLEYLLDYTQYKVSIFDRTGRVLYHSENVYEPWDGTYMGRDLPSADYWFIITLHEPDKEVRGHFTLLR